VTFLRIVHDDPHNRRVPKGPTIDDVMELEEMAGRLALVDEARLELQQALSRRDVQLAVAAARRLYSASTLLWGISNRLADQ